MAYGRKLTFGRDYIIPTPFDPRLIHRHSTCCRPRWHGNRCCASPDRGHGRLRTILKSRMDPTQSILRGLNARARANQHTVVFAEGDDPRVLRAAVMYQRSGMGKL